MTDTTLSRFSSQDSANWSPGCCITCKGISGPFVDMNTRINIYGTAYLCVNCLREMADVMGLLAPQVTVEDPNFSEVKNAINNYVDFNSGLIDSLLTANSRVSDFLATLAEENVSANPVESDGAIELLPELTSEQGSAGVSSAPSDELPELDGDAKS